MESSMRYAVVIEKGQSNYSAYVPDLPGCVAVGDTIEETEKMIQEAIKFHIEGMRAEGLPARAKHNIQGSGGPFRSEVCRRVRKRAGQLWRLRSGLTGLR